MPRADRIPTVPVTLVLATRLLRHWAIVKFVGLSPLILSSDGRRPATNCRVVAGFDRRITSKAVEALAAHVNLDLTWFGFFTRRQANRQYAILVLSRDLRGIDR